MTQDKGWRRWHNDAIFVHPNWASLASQIMRFFIMVFERHFQIVYYFIFFYLFVWPYKF